MKKTEFIRLLSEYCEFEKSDYSLDTQFKTVDGYDSLALMSIIAFVDENFGMKLTASQIREMKDFKSLITIIGTEKFDHD